MLHCRFASSLLSVSVTFLNVASFERRHQRRRVCFRPFPDDDDDDDDSDEEDGIVFEGSDAQAPQVSSTLAGSRFLVSGLWFPISGSQSLGSGPGELVRSSSPKHLESWSVFVSDAQRVLSGVLFGVCERRSSVVGALVTVQVCL